MHLLATKTGLVQAIDQRLQLLKIHRPYHESDHVLNIAYNFLAGGTHLEHLELRRRDEVYLDALGAECIPDPTTAGDFCRRFGSGDVEQLMAAVNECRLDVWQQQPEAFFEEALIDADGVLVPTHGSCKAGMEFSYGGLWGYHPLVVSLGNTAEPLYIENRPGNCPSHRGVIRYYRKAIRLCHQAGFRKITLRGDTDFGLTRYFDEWDDRGAHFVFGMDARSKVVGIAESLPSKAWKRLKRPAKYEVQTTPRGRRPRVKEHIVTEREFKCIRLQSEDVASFAYRPYHCQKTYRMVVVRKNLTIERGERALFDDIRYFFYVTNDPTLSDSEVVFKSNQRCNQENLIEQLKNGPRALHAPLDNLLSNWAYMVMASLAWTLKAWFALSLPETGRWASQHREQKQAVLRMEFKTFCNALMNLPAQIVRTGRRVVFRMLSWNPWQPVLFRLVDTLHQRRRC
jgi:hypothetical protein